MFNCLAFARAKAICGKQFCNAKWTLGRLASINTLTHTHMLTIWHMKMENAGCISVRTSLHTSLWGPFANLQQNEHNKANSGQQCFDTIEALNVACFIAVIVVDDDVFASDLLLSAKVWYAAHVIVYIKIRYNLSECQRKINRLYAKLKLDFGYFGENVSANFDWSIPSNERSIFLSATANTHFTDYFAVA